MVGFYQHNLKNQEFVLLALERKDLDFEANFLKLIDY